MRLLRKHRKSLVLNLKKMLYHFKKNELENFADTEDWIKVSEYCWNAVEEIKNLGFRFKEVSNEEPKTTLERLYRLLFKFIANFHPTMEFHEFYVPETIPEFYNIIDLLDSEKDL